MCPIHQVEQVLVPAGVSKRTGKAYDAFYACDVCKALKKAQAPKPVQNQYIPKAEKPETDWGSIGKQKALCGMVNGMLSAGAKPAEIDLLALQGIFNKIQTLSGAAVTPVATVATPTVHVPSDDEPPVDSFMQDPQA
jgi:hypothetical protein